MAVGRQSATNARSCARHALVCGSTPKLPEQLWWPAHRIASSVRCPPRALNWRYLEPEGIAQGSASISAGLYPAVAAASKATSSRVESPKKRTRGARSLSSVALVWAVGLCEGRGCCGSDERARWERGALGTMKPKGVIHMCNVRAVRSTDTKIEIDAGVRTYILEAASASEATAWVHAIEFVRGNVASNDAQTCRHESSSGTEGRANCDASLPHATPSSPVRESAVSLRVSRLRQATGSSKTADQSMRRSRALSVRGRASSMLQGRGSCVVGTSSTDYCIRYGLRWHITSCYGMSTWTGGGGRVRGGRGGRS